MKKTAILIALALAMVAVQSFVQQTSMPQQQKLLRHVVMF